MSRFIVVRDCWRWAELDDAGKPVRESEHSYPDKALVLEDLERFGKPGSPDVPVEIVECGCST